MSIADPQQIDANRRTINSNEAFVLSSEWTFVTETTGTVGAHTLFTVTGTIVASMVAVCSSNLTAAGASTVAGGVNGFPNLLLGTQTATDIDDEECWVIDDLNFGGNIGDPHVTVRDILLTVANADAVTGGVLTFYLMWRPLSTDASVTVATPA